MTEQHNIYNNTLSDSNINKFWMNHPPPYHSPSQSVTSVNSLDYRMPFLQPPKISSCNHVTQINTMSPYHCNHNNFNYQDQYIPKPYNPSTSSSFPPLPDNIDKDYILKYICPMQQFPKDPTDLWIENWLSSKEKDIQKPNVQLINVKIHEISNKIKECKTLLENLNNSQKIMKQNLSTMTNTDWENSCSNLYSIKEQIDTIIKTLNFDDNFIDELKFKLNKRKKKRYRLKRLKSDLKIIKLQEIDEINEMNRKIDAWQNILKGNILKEKRTIETKIEANIVLKGVRGKIDDAKNQLLLFDTLEKLRKCRLQNFVNKRKNPYLEESLNKLKIIWQQKLTDYYEEEENLKNMLTKAEVEKQETEVHENLLKWDQILFGPDYRSHEIKTDNLYAFLDIRKDWDGYIKNEPSGSSNIPNGWIVPPMACNSEWAKYSNCVNLLKN